GAAARRTDALRQSEPVREGGSGAGKGAERRPRRKHGPARGAVYPIRRGNGSRGERGFRNYRANCVTNPTCAGSRLTEQHGSQDEDRRGRGPHDKRQGGMMRGGPSSRGGEAVAGAPTPRERGVGAWSTGGEGCGRQPPGRKGDGFLVAGDRSRARAGAQSGGWGRG